MDNIYLNLPLLPLKLYNIHQCIEVSWKITSVSRNEPISSRINWRNEKHSSHLSHPLKTILDAVLILSRRRCLPANYNCLLRLELINQT